MNPEAALTESLRIGVDIGGTFTDLSVVDGAGKTVLVWKVDTTHGRYVDAIKEGIESLASELGLSTAGLLGKVDVFVHGSTIATNMLLERNGPVIGMVTTEGFRDSLYFRDAFKADRYNIRLRRPAPVVERHLRLGVSERIGSDGEIIRPLDEQSVRRVASELADSNVEAVAVSLLWAHANPSHEVRVGEILADELPQIPVILSSEVLPEMGEWVRGSATALSAYVYPATVTYLRGLEEWLTDNGLKSSLLMMQINGGCVDIDQCLKAPVALVHSGPSAAPVAARQVARRIAEPSPLDVMAIDMGGTSFDVTLLQAGRVPLSRELRIDEQPVGVPGVDLHSIGSGGGSEAWVDSGGALRVGPDSAGSDPGPAAYNQGGEKPTVTDANLVLGYLPDQLLGGRKRLSVEHAEDAIRNHVAEPLGLSVEQAAFGIIRVVDEDMVGAMREVSIERGIDPRSYLLVAGGGAGPLHAARLARSLEMRQVLFPVEAGGLSSFGMTVTDVRQDYSFALPATSEDLPAGEIADRYADLEAKARRNLEESGLDPAHVYFEYSVDARYVGQVHSLMTRLSGSRLDSREIKALRLSFENAHRARFSFDLPGQPMELLQWRLSAIVPRQTDAIASFRNLSASSSAAAQTGFRNAVFDSGADGIEAPVFEANLLDSGAMVAGPAIIDSETSTIVVPTGDSLVADGHGNLLLTSG